MGFKGVSVAFNMYGSTFQGILGLVQSTLMLRFSFLLQAPISTLF